MKTLFLARNLPVAPYRVVLRREWARDAAGIRGAWSGAAFPGVREAGQPRVRASAFPRPRTRPSSRDAMSGAAVRPEDRRRGGRPERAGDRVRGAGQRRPAGIRARRDHSAARVLRLRSEVHGRERIAARESRRRSPMRTQRDPAACRSRRSVRVDCSGLARVDFLWRATPARSILNEVNTLPGFTTISMYPKLWEASGVSYARTARAPTDARMERHREKQQLRTSLT